MFSTKSPCLWSRIVVFGVVIGTSRALLSTVPPPPPLYYILGLLAVRRLRQCEMPVAPRRLTKPEQGPISQNYTQIATPRWEEIYFAFFFICAREEGGQERKQGKLKFVVKVSYAVRIATCEGFKGLGMWVGERFDLFGHNFASYPREKGLHDVLGVSAIECWHQCRNQQTVRCIT